MFIKHFRTVRFRVPDPTRPGRTAFDERMDSSGTESITHNGVTYESDSDNWFDVPEPVAQYFLRYPGWRTPEQVDEETVAGRIKREEMESQTVNRQGRKPHRVAGRRS